MKTVGIVGGLGPETASEFYLEVIKRARPVISEAYPSILMHSVPVPFEVERKMVEEGRGEEEMLPVLEKGVKLLEGGGADFIVIPCNTVHVFHPQLEALLQVPLLNILEVTARSCKTRGWRKVGTLGTGKTLESRLYENALEQTGLEPVVLPAVRRGELSALIYRILTEKSRSKDRGILLDMIEGLRGEGAEGVILGCTDLQLLITEEDTDLPIPVIDSMRCLADEVVERLRV